MEDIKITNQELITLAKEALPKILKDKFESSYSNPLSDVLDKILKSDSFKLELERIIMEVFDEVKTEVDFKIFVKEAIVNSVVKNLQNKSC